MSTFSVSQILFFLRTTYSLGLHRLLLSSFTVTYILFFSLSILSFYRFFSVLHFQCLERQSGKDIKLTISTKDKYKNIPAVTVKIQFWTHGSVDTERPVYSPMKAVRALRKFIRMAILTGSPELRSTAKSPAI